MKISTRHAKDFQSVHGALIFNIIILYAYLYLNKCQEQKMEAKLAFELHIQYKGLDQGHMEHTWLRQKK